MTPREIRALARRYYTSRSYGSGNNYFATALAPWLIGPIVEWTCAAILLHAPDAQAVAFRGMSGAAVAPLVAYRLGLNPLGVRKGESSHGGDTFYPEGLSGEKISRYVIVDDFVSSGSTVLEIRRTAEARFGLERCLGVFQYTRLAQGPEIWRRMPDVPCYGTLPLAWSDSSLDERREPPREPQPKLSFSWCELPIQEIKL